MSDDARFEDGGDAPLRLRALDSDDLTVIAALVQDAIFPAVEMRFDRKARRFALLLNRFRWEDASNAQKRARDFERVQAVLAFEDVMAVRTQGVSKADPDMIYSLLAVEFVPAEDGAGQVMLTLAGDGAIALEVETLEAVLRDVTRPYIAPSRQAPSHDT
ncbi:DUF2948 family protein [Yoonia sp. 208BN28-4]|uniref:DUF2948 family protein n=1 Tax=Yoonia sp. 208BN28-4 TaxID=3126505 RepID=UPI0030A13715